LRGHLTRWLLEISAGVFVGFVSARVRELMWERVVELAKDGKAIMVYSARGEQRLAFRVHRHQWQPVDVDGVTLMLRPVEGTTPQPTSRSGWSKASKYRMATKRKRA
jgi:CRISPR-associated protein Cas2